MSGLKVREKMSSAVYIKQATMPDFNWFSCYYKPAGLGSCLHMVLRAPFAFPKLKKIEANKGVRFGGQLICAMFSARY